MPTKVPTTFDLHTLHLDLGESKSFDLDLFLPAMKLAGQEYAFAPDVVPARLEITYVGRGFSARLDFHGRLEGACWRCLEPADIVLDVSVDDFFETTRSDMGDEADTEDASFWYRRDGLINLSEWARDAVAELLPAKILCAPDCRGLCPQCGTDLNVAACECRPPADSRWEKLSEWKAE